MTDVGRPTHLLGRRTRLDAGVAAEVRRHGEETYPHECCGALIGKDGVIASAFPLPNMTEEGPRRRFLVRPSDYRLAERRATEQGGELFGFYHSHPDHPARPSQFDLDHAWPTFAYIIVAVASGRAAAMTVWWLKGDRSGFEEGVLDGDKDFDSDTAATVHG